MEKENIIIIMVSYTKAPLLMAKKMVSALLLFLKRPKLRHIGTRLIYKDKEKYSIIMAIILREIIIFPKNQDKECTFGKISSTKVNSPRIICKVLPSSDIHKMNIMKVI